MGTLHQPYGINSRNKVQRKLKNGTLRCSTLIELIILQYLQGKQTDSKFILPILPGQRLVIRGKQCHYYINLRNFTQRHDNYVEFQVLEFFLVFRKQRNSDSRSNKTSIFIDKVHFTLPPWIRQVAININEEKKLITV